MRKARTEATKQFYVGIGEKIAKVRQSVAQTQQGLANAIGLTRTTVVNIESGKQQLLLHTFVQIADALGSAPADLMSKPPATNLAEEDAINLLVTDPRIRSWVQKTIKTTKNRQPKKVDAV